jgi:signal transduction histidine kinase
VSDLLDTQKIELRQLKLNKESHDLVELISHVIDTIKEDANKNEITITKNVPKTCTCFCDRMRLEQVLTNVISNSLDFCPKGTGVIDIALTNENNQVKLTISDNGMGIEKEKLGNLFVKFYQADSTASREHGGSGLGLAVCKGVIESHGGKIWAESEGLGKGMKIYILLPVE